ncbi:MAG TPA: IS4 family transposase [Candidatus Sulfomarinibacteraceae bacterium]|nr:IS4 family transposase [Candidatus Sulfomarinibacteraceae bacterium]
MPHNLRLYHRVLQQIEQWLPGTRATQRRNLALLVSGLVSAQGIHLSYIVSTWHVAGRLVSLVNRLRRFLGNERVDVWDWYRPLAAQLLASLAQHPLRLVLDSTKVGQGHRVLVVGVAYRRRTLPLVWSVHGGGRGQTGHQAQIALLQRLVPLIPSRAEVWVLGDTEFESIHLLRWLARRHWHFVIRQRGSIKVSSQGQTWSNINAFPLSEGQTRVVGWVRLTEKFNVGWFWLVLHWAQGEDEPWYLVSDHSDTSKLLRLYRRRMWIEEMYGDMKGHGFDLEATHLRHADRISRLMLGMCIAFVWFLCLGSWVIKRGFRHLIDRKSRRDKSYFRLGWDWLRRCRRLGQPLKLHFRPYL